MLVIIMNKQDYFEWLNELTDLDDRLNQLRQYAKMNNVPIIQDEGIVFLKHMMKLKNVQDILEVGSAIGYSAISMALIDPSIKVTTIERDDTMFHEANQNIANFQLSDRIKLIHADALLLDEAELEGHYDLLFIDAAKSQYQKFFEKYTPYVKKGGIVVTDNLIFHDLIFETDIKNKNTRRLVEKIRDYNEWLKHNTDYDTFFYSIGDGIAVSIKK